jgi:hypothetical protein
LGVPWKSGVGGTVEERRWGYRGRAALGVPWKSGVGGTVEERRFSAAFSSLNNEPGFSPTRLSS